MRASAMRQYEMFVRVQDFCHLHQDLFPESSVGGQAIEAIAKTVALVREHTAAALSTGRGGTVAKAAARRALEARLAAIGRAARVIAAAAPGFDEPFRRPHRRQLDHTLLAAGHAVVRCAGRFDSQFIALGMPQTFVEDLAKLVDRFEQATRGCEAVKVWRAGSKAGTAAALASAFEALRTLDVIGANQWHMDPAMMAAWQRVRRVDYQRGQSIAPPPSVRQLSVSVLSGLPASSGLPALPAVPASRALR